MDRNGAPDREAKGKGKGKAVADPDSAEHPQKYASTNGGESPALGSRIMNSASALSKSMFSGRPSTTGLAALASGEKGQSQGSQGRQEKAGESSILFRSGQPQGEGFRSSHAQEHVAREEAAFADFLDSTSVFVPTQINTMERAWQASTAPGESQETRLAGGPPAFSSLAEQEGRDGQDVVTLLSSDHEEALEFADDEISPEARSSLRKALFGNRGSPSDRTSSLEWDNVLNFIPEYLRDGHSNEVKAQESRVHLGTTNLDEASKSWIDQWSRVLAKYQDEVWGDLGSLVEEARTEVQKLEDVRGDDPPFEPKALLRLKAILNHLRGP